MNEFLFLFLILIGQSQYLTPAKSQGDIEKYRIEYTKCNSMDFERVWINDSTYTECVTGSSRKDTFMLTNSGFYCMRKGNKYEYLSLQSFLKKDTITVYGTEYIKSTRLLPISDVYIPERRDTLFGKEVLIYRVKNSYGNTPYSTDYIFFDPEDLLIVKYKSLECGDGILRRLD